MNSKWEYRKIGDVCIVERGGSPRPIDQYITNDANGINWIKIGDTSESMYITETAQKIKPEGMKKSRYVQPGDFLLSNSMSFGRPYILKTDGCIHDGWLVLRDKNSFFDKRFLYYYLSAKPTYEKFKMIAVGGVVNNLNSEMVRKISVPVPCKAEQIEIANLLDIVNRIILKRKQTLQKLDELVKARFVEMFGDRYVNDKNWNTTKLGNSISFNNGKAHEQIVDENGEYILVTSRAIASNFKDVRRTNELLSPLRKDDIVMVMSDVPNGRALAKCQLIKDNNKYTLNQRICSFDNYNYNPVFLLFLLSRHPYFLSFNDGNGQTNLRKNDILDCELIDPPIELQEQFADFVSQVDKSKVAVQKSLDEAQLLFDSLMQQYFG